VSDPNALRPIRYIVQQHNLKVRRQGDNTIAVITDVERPTSRTPFCILVDVSNVYLPQSVVTTAIKPSEAYKLAAALQVAAAILEKQVTVEQLGGF
jgi:hypothetical protein